MVKLPVIISEYLIHNDLLIMVVPQSLALLQLEFMTLRYPSPVAQHICALLEKYNEIGNVLLHEIEKTGLNHGGETVDLDAPIDEPEITRGWSPVDLDVTVCRDLMQHECCLFNRLYIVLKYQG